jgi:tripartite-type tricarboxylate transporter receptor subunit TctC
MQLVHVPYKGNAAAHLDLAAGAVQLMFNTTIGSMAPIKSGRVRALAVSGTARVAALPDLPTIAEAGLPGFAVTQWYGLVAPAGTPERIVALLNRRIAALLRAPEMARRLALEGSEPAGGSAAEFAALVGSERARWARVIQRTEAPAAR